MTSAGTLFLCATPIGNLEDITLRALRVLSEVNLIIAEDTRRTAKLLHHYQIQKPVISFHAHSRQSRKEKIISLLLKGNQVALVSDSGMPVISDPGEDLVRGAVEKAIPVVVVPGANAAITALCYAGMPSVPFTFYGFLPRKKTERKKILNEISSLAQTSVFYEAPHRILKTLQCMEAVLGKRELCVAREMTKLHEEILRGTAGEIRKQLSEAHVRGEFTIVVERARYNKLELKDGKDTLMGHLSELLGQGVPKKQAIKEVARMAGVPKRSVYSLSLQPEGEKHARI